MLVKLSTSIIINSALIINHRMA